MYNRGYRRYAASLMLILLSIVLRSFEPAADPDYLNPGLPVEKRLADLLSRMTLEEKIAQMCQYVGPDHIKKAEQKLSSEQLKNSDAYGFYPGLGVKGVEELTKQGMIGSFLHVVTVKEANNLQHLAAQSRLKIPLLIGIDAIHGNGMVSGSTVYPSPIGLSSTWDTALINKVAHYTAKEMRATGSHWAFSPNLDVARDPRWGRVGETFGEDPFLVTAMGISMIKGLQGTQYPEKYDVLACAKHLVAGSQPVNGLNKAPTDISERTLQELFLPPFKAAISAGVYTVMPAHNEINGIPSHANRYLMEDLLRKQWGFNGFYISDFMDIERLAEIHKIAPDQKEAVRLTVNAGMDMHMHGPGFMEPLLALIREGVVSEDRITQSAKRILEAKFRLGLFEQRYVPEKSNIVFNQEHLATALESARKSIVLLKNNGVLPLQLSSSSKILVVGPNANNQAMLGDWSLEQPSANITTVLNGLKAAVKGSKTVIDHVNMGRNVLDIEDAMIDEACNSAKNADVIVAVVGDNSLRYEGKRTAGENIDRDNLSLPGMQQELIERLHLSGKPLVVVLINGRPLNLSWINKNVAAILEAWEPGSVGGTAIADVLLGKVNPAGKLTVSFPQHAGQTGTFYNHKPSHYVKGFSQSETGPVFAFGYGLSYTSFQYGDPSANKSVIKDGESIEVRVDITNTGKMAGEEIVQLYINGSVSEVTKPVKELKGFKRVYLQPGEKRTIVFDILPELLFSFDINMKYGIEKGDFTIMVGGSSLDKDLKKIKLSIR